MPASSTDVRASMFGHEPDFAKQARSPSSRTDGVDDPSARTVQLYGEAPFDEALCLWE